MKGRFFFVKGAFVFVRPFSMHEKSPCAELHKGFEKNIKERIKVFGSNIAHHGQYLTDLRNEFVAVRNVPLPYPQQSAAHGVDLGKVNDKRPMYPHQIFVNDLHGKFFQIDGQHVLSLRVRNDCEGTAARLDVQYIGNVDFFVSVFSFEKKTVLQIGIKIGIHDCL